MYIYTQSSKYFDLNHLMMLFSWVLTYARKKVRKLTNPSFVYLIVLFD